MYLRRKGARMDPSLEVLPAKDAALAEDSAAGLAQAASTAALANALLR